MGQWTIRWWQTNFGLHSQLRPRYG